LADKAEKARVQKIHADANKIVAKVGPLITQLSQIAFGPEFDKLSTVMKKKLTEATKQMKTFEDEARARLSANDPIDMTLSFADVATASKEATKAKVALQSMLDTVKKM